MTTETNGAQAIPLEMAEKVLHQGEAYLSAQLQSALASDQRAMTLAAFFASVSTATGAGTLAYLNAEGALAISLAGITASAIMAIGAGLCLWAARPVNFYFPGTHPACWEDVLSRPLGEVLWGKALNYQDNIEKNESFLETNSYVLYRGAMVAATAPIAAFVVFGLTSLFCPVAGV